MIKASCWTAKNLRNIEIAIQASSGGGKNLSSPRLEGSHGACRNIHTCVLK